MLRKSRGNPFFHFTTRKTGAIVTISKKLLRVDLWILYLCALCQGQACAVTSEYYSDDITLCRHRKRRLTCTRCRLLWILPHLFASVFVIRVIYVIIMNSSVNFDS
ncbi:F10U14 [Hyposoter didymator ichnovirus]|nr:F10U14 [Hyposoter didymator ichnovirus]